MDLYPIIPPPIELMVAIGGIGAIAFVLGQEIGHRIAYHLGLA